MRGALVYATLGLAACGPAGLDGYWVELHGRVLGEDGAAIEGATVTLASHEGASVAAVRTNGEGEWRAPLYGTELDGNVLVALVRAEGYAEGRATYDVNLRSPDVTTLRAGPVQTWEATTRRLAAVRLGEDAPTATVSGRLLDAVTGLPVADVPLALQEGWNASVGDAAVGATTTGAAGDFTFQTAKPGVYTVTASEREGYGPARFPALLTASGGRAVGLVGPPVAAGQLRASLSWGASPFDLDLHLSAPLKGGIAGASGTGQYHVWSEAPDHPELVPEDERDAWMERADADGQGPETVWVESLADRGDVRLSVFDTDNRSDADSTALADSGAVLQVWFGEDTPRYYTVSPGEIGSLWHPVEMDVSSYLTYAVEQWSYGENPSDPAAF